MGPTKPYRNGWKHLSSSREHKSCWDCENIRVAGFPNRLCNISMAEYDIWSGNAEDEFRETGRTQADACGCFYLDGSLRDMEYAESEVLHKILIAMNITEEKN